jgi:predicted nucleotide-binding protein
MKKKFQVAIMHGHSKEYTNVRKYIEKSGFTSRILIDEYNADTIFENLRNLIWDDIHCVIVILSCDDTTNENKKRARQNVVFELGYCFGAFDSLPDSASYKASDAIIVLAEEDIELFADIDGLRKIYFQKDRIEEKKETIIKALERSFEKAKIHYEF